MHVTTTKRRSGIKIMASLIVLLGSLSYIMLLAIVNGSLGFLSAMGVPVLGAIGIAKVLGENIALSYEMILFLVILCGVIRGVLRYFEQYSNHYIAFRLLALLRDKIFQALRILCPAKLESKQKGNIIAMITADIETLEVFYAHTISPICIAILVSLCVILFVGYTSGCVFSWIALCGYICIGMIIPIVFSNYVKASGMAYRESFASFNAYFLDSIKGMKDIVLNNEGERRIEQVNQKSEVLLIETKKMKQKIAKASAASEAFVSIFILFTLAVGIHLVQTESLSLGKMILGIVCVFSSFGPVLAISALPGNLTQTFASGERVLQLLKEKPVVEKKEDGERFVFETLKVKDVAFAYEDHLVLKNVNMELNKGEIVGIVGESGCGKSTLLKLLLQFWHKKSGSIQYNGIDIENIQSDNLLENVTMVSQTTYLFDETIEANLRIAKLDASMEEIKEACRMASIHDFIMSLPEGYQTRVGMLGDRLSAGEKQRIGLARAFLKGNEVILLDEPTSNVDSINEGMILQALQKVKHQKSILLVSHRASTMSICDRIYHFENGCIK